MASPDNVPRVVNEHSTHGIGNYPKRESQRCVSLETLFQEKSKAGSRQQRKGGLRSPHFHCQRSCFTLILQYFLIEQYYMCIMSSGCFLHLGFALDASVSPFFRSEGTALRRIMPLTIKKWPVAGRVRAKFIPLRRIQKKEGRL